MAYQSEDLSVAWYANGHTSWYYTTPNTSTHVLTAGYFNDACDMLRIGDGLTVNCNTDEGGREGYMILHVNSVKNGVVSVEMVCSNGKGFAA